jgi:hypothetical protein
VDSLAHNFTYDDIIDPDPNTDYLASGLVSFNNNAPNSLWKSAYIDNTLQLDMPTFGLSDGDYYVYSQDDSGLLSAPSQIINVTQLTGAGSTRANSPVDVVFDLVHGVSTQMGDNIFNTDQTYNIYIVVDTNSGRLFTTPQTGANNSASWNQWFGGSALGADDHIYLVGNDATHALVGRAGNGHSAYLTKFNSAGMGHGCRGVWGECRWRFRSRRTFVQDLP